MAFNETKVPGHFYGVLSGSPDSNPVRKPMATQNWFSIYGDPPAGPNSPWVTADMAKNSATSSGAAGLPTTTTGGNLSAAPNLQSLSDLVNSINRTAQQSANSARIPNNPALEQQSSGNIASELGGQIPGDVLAQLSQRAAERGVATGSPGSPNNNAAFLRSLGLTSLDLQQLGQQNLSAADARNPVAKLFDPSTQLLTPFQSGTLQNEANRTALDFLRALTGGGGGRGNGGGGTSGGGGSRPTTPDNSWYGNLLNQAMSGANPASGTGSSYYGAQPANPILDTDFGFGDPSGAYQPYGTVNTPGSSYYDPYYGSGYGDYSSYQQPADTVNTADSSYYDPFSGYY